MANELKCNLSLSFNKGGAKASRSESFSVDVTGNAYHSGVQNIADDTAEDLMDNADIGSIGYFYLKLLAVGVAGTYISYGYANSVLAGKIEVGESVLVKAIHGAANLWVKASAADTTEIEYCIIEV
tara:strand:- start:980 stop:1357 length:378 start_codon:yes stop_codon:yes gene_type:complete